jgi:hypothetical protein
MVPSNFVVEHAQRKANAPSVANDLARKGGFTVS